MGLTLTVLGSSGTYAGPGNACSGYLVTGDGTSVWLDCGPGTLANLQRHVGLDELDGVVVSHHHPDHWLELPVLHNALKYGSDRRELPVFGTADTRRALEGVLGDCSSPTFDWTVVTDGDRFEIGAIEFTCSRTDHPVETLAQLVRGGGSTLLYSADTGPGWRPAPSLPGIDLALVEATLPSSREREGLHLSGRQAGQLAHEAGAARLVITHVWPTDDPDDRRRDAEAAFGRPVDVAVPHQSYQL